MADNEHKTIITPRQITSPRISAGVNRCPENATPTVFFGHIRVHHPRLVLRDIKYIPDDRSSRRSRWKREPLSSSVVAEDGKEAKEGDGKRANGIDEKERIVRSSRVLRLPCPVQHSLMPVTTRAPPHASCCG
jgi:hypothetical protein